MDFHIAINAVAKLLGLQKMSATKAPLNAFAKRMSGGSLAKDVSLEHSTWRQTTRKDARNASVLEPQISARVLIGSKLRFMKRLGGTLLTPTTQTLPIPIPPLSD